MKIVVRGVLLCAFCCEKDPDFMDVWLRDELVVAVVVHCKNCAYVHYSHCPIVDDEIIVRVNRMHWIRHSRNPALVVNGTLIGYRHSLFDPRNRQDFER